MSAATLLAPGTANPHLMEKLQETHARLLHPEVPISPSSLLEKLLELGQEGWRAPQRMG